MQGVSQTLVFQGLSSFVYIVNKTNKYNFLYFKNNIISLTTDITKIEEWQGGDIIVFKKHIGIISDKRNKSGIPFVIHHANPYQIRYEEDILEGRTDIIGHYRIS